MLARCRMASRTGSQWRSSHPRVVRTGSLRTQSARHRVDHGTICGRSCANSGHCKPLCACVDRTKFVAPASVGGPEFFCGVCVGCGRAWARGGDCESTSPRSLDELAQLRTHTAHYSPVMNAPLSINSSHADCRPERSFFLSCGRAPAFEGQYKPLCAYVDRKSVV